MAYISFQPHDYFNTKLWNGNSVNNTAITGVGFAPNFVWGKQRTSTEHHQLLDSIRGANNILISSGSNSAVQDSNILNSFDSDGFTLGNQDQLNDTGDTYVGWSWKAGTTGSGTSSGSGTGKAYSYSVSTTSGFSIVKYVGNGTAGHTIPHHLGAVPKMIMAKNLGRDEHWRVYHASLGNDKKINLNLTTIAGSGSEWNSTTPTSSVFSIGTGEQINYNDDNYIAYCFADLQGFSKIGSYVGNGEPANDAPFIYTGFKPAFVLLTSSSYAGQHWAITDNRRLGYNGDSAWLKADNLGAELTNLVNPDLLSNGFKLQNNNDIYNKNGQSYIYMAFAESPLVSSNGVPTCAE